MANNNEIKIVLQVATAKGKAQIKSFTNTAEKDLDSFSQKGRASVKKLGKSFVKYLGAAAAGAVVAKGFNRMISKGKEFEQQLADLEAITGIAGDDLDGLSQRALDSSVKYGESAANIIEANKLVASQLANKIDFETQEGIAQLKDISEQAIVLQKAAGIDLKTAVETTTTAINQFNEDASATPRIINSIAAGAKYGAAEARDQSEAYREAGSVFAAAGEDLEVLNASTQILAQNAIKGGRAGTGLRNVMTIMQSEAKKLADEGIHDLNVENDGFIESLRKLKPLQKDTAALARIFGRENLTAAQLLIKNVNAVEQMNEKVRGTKTAYEQAEIQLNTFKGAQSQLASALDKELIATFQETNGVGVRLLQTVTSLIGSIGEAIGQMNKMANRTDRIQNITGDTFNPFDDYGGAAQLDEMLDKTRAVKAETRGLRSEAEVYAQKLEELPEGSPAYEAAERQLKRVRTALRQLRGEIKRKGEDTKAEMEILKEQNKNYGLQEERLEELRKRYKAADEVLNDYGRSLQEEREQIKKQIAKHKEGTISLDKVNERISAKKRAEEAANQSQDETNQKTDQATQATLNYSDAVNKLRYQIDQLPEDSPIKAPLSGDQLKNPGFNPGEWYDIGSERDLNSRIRGLRNQRAQTADQDEYDKLSRDIEKATKKLAAFKKENGQVQEQMKPAEQATLMLADAFLQAAIQGQDLFGILGNLARQLASKALITGIKFLLGGGTGSFFGSVFGFSRGGQANAKVVGAAAGGKVYGPGTITSDSIPAMLSDREYVVNATSADSMPEVLADGNASPSRARAINTLYSRFKRAPTFSSGGRAGGLPPPIPKDRYPDLSIIDRVVAASKSPADMKGFEMIAEKIDNQTGRLEKLETTVKWNVSELEDARKRYKLKEQGVGRG